MFRDKRSVWTWDMEFINPNISKAVCDLCRSNAGPPGDGPKQVGLGFPSSKFFTNFLYFVELFVAQTRTFNSNET